MRDLTSGLVKVLDDFPAGSIILDGKDEVWVRLPSEPLWRNIQGFRVWTAVIAERGPAVILYKPRHDETIERRKLLAETSVRLSAIPAGRPVRVTIESWTPLDDQAWDHHVDSFTEGDMR